ncbi:MAG: glycosyltransferase [Herpetosiphonaceae bacterium]|nr:glycosyltransferase [Herpetosiphonaceae bacterium]
MAQPIAYVMSRFPHLPETFILREMVEMERNGWSVRLYPLMIQEQTIIHAEAERWIPLARSSPFMSLGVLKANLQAIFQHPWRYMSIWGRTLAAHWRSPAELVRVLALLPKTVAMAQKMVSEGVVHVHAHYATYPAFAAWVIHHLTNLPYSITVHAHDIFVSQTMLGPKLRSAMAVVAISEYNREFLARHVGDWVRSKTHVIHCGISPANYVPRTLTQPTSPQFEIITIGSLQPYKGHPFLIQACALLRDQGLAFRCRIIGGGEDRALLEQLIAERQLQDCVELLGPQPEDAITRLLPSADCYVQPSIITESGKMEGIPVALMEAMACGLPVVATDLSGVPELVRPSQTGYLVPPADAPALAAALAQVANNLELARQHGAEGRRLVLDAFNLQTNVAELAQLLRSTSAAAPGSAAPGEPSVQATL